MSKTELFKRYRIYVLIGVAFLLVLLNLGSPAPTGRSTATQLVAPTWQADFVPAPAAQETLAQNTNATATPATAQVLSGRPMLEPAKRDPFNVLPPPPPPPVKVAASPPLAPMGPPVPPPPPPLDMTFAGRMTKPDGGELIYVNYAGTSLAIVAGQSLPNGYRVESISGRAIEFSYPPLNTTARIELPDAPRYEIR